MSENVYARYENYSLGETFTKEQILDMISQAIENGAVQNVDWGAVSTLKEINKNLPLRIWIGTTAEYEAIEKKKNNVLYIMTDDTSAAEIKNALAMLRLEMNTRFEQTDNVADSAYNAAFNYAPNISFLSDESGFYYLNSQGDKMTDDQMIDGIPYQFASNGVLNTGWRTVFGKRYYYSPIDGNIQLGWIKYTDKDYYVSIAKGKYVSGIYLINGKFYQFDDQGVAIETAKTEENSLTLGYTAKNLLKNTVASSTVYDVEFTVNADGSVTANGTATNDVLFKLGDITSNGKRIYILSGCPAGGTNTTYQLCCRYIEPDEMLNEIEGAHDYGNGAEFTAAFDFSVFIKIGAGTTLENLTFYPMLRDSSIADSKYVPHKPTVEERLSALENAIFGGNSNGGD